MARSGTYGTKQNKVEWPMRHQSTTGVNKASKHICKYIHGLLKVHAVMMES